MSFRNARFLTQFMTLGLMFFVNGVQIVSQEHEQVTIEHAEQMLGYKTATGEVRELQGNVVLLQGDIRLSCDRARQELASGRIDVIGSVRIERRNIVLTMRRGVYHSARKYAMGEGDMTIREGHMVLNAPRGEYDLTAQRAVFRGGVELQDDSVTITSDSLAYERRTQERYAWGSVRVAFHYDRTVIFGDSAYHRTATPSLALVCGHAQMMRWDTATADTLLLIAECLHRVQDSASIMFRALRNVAMIYGALHARADTAIMHADKQFVLIGKPLLWADSAQLSGNCITGILNLRHIDNVRACGNASMGIVDDSLSKHPHQLLADTIALTFQHDSLRAVMGYGSVRTLYHHRTETGEADGMTQVASDSINLTIIEGVIKQVLWYGNVRSLYIPEHLVQPKERFLHGFNWRTEMKPRREELLYITSGQLKR